MQSDRCPYCPKDGLSSSKALNSHISQSPYCLARWAGTISSERTPSPVNKEYTTENGTAEELADDTPSVPFATHHPSPPAPPPQARHPPNDADVYCMRLPHAGTKLRRAKTVHERIRDAQIEQNLPPYAPFKSLEEWEHLQWLITSGASQKKIDDHLKLKSVRLHLESSLFPLTDIIRRSEASTLASKTSTPSSNTSTAFRTGRSGPIETYQSREPCSIARERLTTISRPWSFGSAIQSSAYASFSATQHSMESRAMSRFESIASWSTTRA